MHTSVLFVALMGPGAAPAIAAPEAPRWQESYQVSRELGRKGKKPLAVFIGRGPSGWDRLTDEGGLTRRARQLLAESYVCTYVDMATPAGQRLAGEFEISSGTGLILSDRECDRQAFWHQGTMSRSELEETLQKFTTASSVRQTERLDRARYNSLVYPDASMRPATNAVSDSASNAVSVTSAYQAPMNHAMVAPATQASGLAAPVNYGGFASTNQAVPANYAVPQSYAPAASYAPAPSFAAAPAYSPPAYSPPASFGGFSGGFGGGFTSGGC